VSGQAAPLQEERPATSARPATAEKAPLSGSWLVVAQVLALGTIFLISSRQFVGQGVTFGHIASLLLLPLWVPAFRRSRAALALGVLGLLAVVASVWLTEFSAVDHEITQNNLISNTLLVVGPIATIGVILWAREYLSVRAIGVTYGLGMLASALTREESFAVNPWKFAIAVPLAVILLSLVEGGNRRALQVLILLALAAASAAFDSRSYFAEFLLAAVLVAWQWIPRSRTRRASAMRVLAIFAVIGLVVYNLGISLLVGGVLGQGAQARSVEQIDRAGNILLGARPEAGASVALFFYRPLGFGAGALANDNDIDAAKAGMRALNYDPDNGYVENFLFGQKFELHSMLGDLWAYSGVVGIAVGLISLVLLIMIITKGVAHRAVGGLVLFVAVQSVWSMFFNPLYSSGPVLALALGLGLSVLTAGKPEHAPELSPAPALAR
jgi:hypothetical protein